MPVTFHSVAIPIRIQNEFQIFELLSVSTNQGLCQWTFVSTGQVVKEGMSNVIRWTAMDDRHHILAITIAQVS